MALLYEGLTIPPAAALNGAAASADRRQLMAAGARSVTPVVYGEDRLGGLILNVLPAGTGSQTLLVQVLWGFALDSVNDVRLNDLALPAGATVTHYTGGQSTPDAAMVTAMAAQSITYTDTLAGYAYTVLAMPSRSFEGQLNITARIRGRRLYDPRLDSTVAGGSGAHRLATPSTWAWSDNPALALADWLSNATYGCGQAVEWATVGAAANHCDASIGAPAERRRTLGLALITPAAVKSVADSLRAHAGCWLVPTVNGIRLLADQSTASSASYSHANGDIARIEPLTLRDSSSAPTVVEVLFTDTTKLPYREASAMASLPGAGTTRPWRLSQVRMPGVQRYSQAMREATERLNKLTLGDLSTVVEVFDIGVRHEIGDVVDITHPVGVTAKPFRIAEPPELLGPGRWRLALVEYDPLVYSTTVQTQASIPDVGLVSTAGPPSAVVGFSATAEQAGVRLRWIANPERDIVGYELRRGGTSWATATPLDGSPSTIVGGTTHLFAQPAAGSYTFRIRALDVEGLLSGSEATTTISAGALVLDNAAITISQNGTLNGAGGGQVSLPSLPGQLVAGQLGAIVDMTKFAAGIRPPRVVGTLPGEPFTGYTAGDTVVLTTDNVLYRFTGTAWTAAVPAGQISGTLADAQIPPISAAKLTGQITGTQITDGAISTPKLAAGAVTAGKIAAGSIQAGDIAAGTITGDRIAANTINADRLVANSITAGQIAAGAISANQIAAGAIEARHVRISANGLNPDPSFSGGGTLWSNFVRRLASTDGNVPAGCPSVTASEFSGRDNLWLGDTIQVSAGEQYRISVWVSGGASGAGLIGCLFYGYGTNGGVQATPVFAVVASPGWQFVTGVYEIPPGIVRINPGAWTNRGFNYSGASWFADLTVEKMNGASLIVDGAITAQKINIKAGATSGQRVEIETNRIRVFDASNVERVRIGSLL